MHSESNQVQKRLDEAGAFLARMIPLRPRVGIILGTGLTFAVAPMAVTARIPYAEIPHFPVPTVEGHPGNLLVGPWDQEDLIVLEGRFHFYEGYSLQEVIFPVQVLRRFGVRTLILTNAAGGLNPSFRPGEIMVITDHINLLGGNPLRGRNVDSLGIRFPSLHEAYSKDLVEKVGKAAEILGLGLRKGVYVAVPGPSLETPAETRFLRMIGADAVGMSTVPEVIAAVHAGMKVLGLSIISNVNRPEAPEPARIEEVIANVQKADPYLPRLIGKILSFLEE